MRIPFNIILINSLIAINISMDKILIQLKEQSFHWYGLPRSLALSHGRIPVHALHLRYVKLILSFLNTPFRLLNILTHPVCCFLGIEYLFLSKYFVNFKLYWKFFKNALPCLMNLFPVITPQEFPRWHSGNESAYQCGSHRRWVWSLTQEDFLEEEMANHSSILAGIIPWTEVWQSTVHRMERVGHD